MAQELGHFIGRLCILAAALVATVAFLDGAAVVAVPALGGGGGFAAIDDFLHGFFLMF